jgi:hypothetical protein
MIMKRFESAAVRISLYTPHPKISKKHIRGDFYCSDNETLRVVPVFFSPCCIPFLPRLQPEERLGMLGQVIGADNPASSEITQTALGWKPTGLSLLQDLTS